MLNDLTALDEWFDDTANLCGVSPQDSEELLARVLYEDFAMSVHSFFHPASLGKLLDAGLITKDIQARCRGVSARVTYLVEHPDAVAVVKDSPEWQDVFTLCDQIQRLKAKYKQPLR
jgi:hypothetical protein